MRYISRTYSFHTTSVVKSLIIANGCIWLFLVVILQGLFFDKNYIFHFLGLTPAKALFDFWLWPILTYSFVHAPGFFHIFLNMLALWMFGSELERLWGAKFFLIYYICCGVGAGLIYLMSLLIGLAFFNVSLAILSAPMVGASGAIFGVLLAYGLLFSERIVFFMLVFPIKARYFVCLIGLAEFVSLVNSGVGSSVSHLAHLAGLLSGFLFLQIWKAVQNFRARQWKKRPSHLQILRDDDNEDERLNLQ